MRLTQQPVQLELDLYPIIKPGQVVKIRGIDFTGYFDLKGFEAIVERPAVGCHSGVWCWILGFKLGRLYPVILEYDIYSLEVTEEVKTPWHRMAYRTQQSMFNKIVN